MDFRRDYLLRLPLPLAQLYSRAHNAKDPRRRVALAPAKIAELGTRDGDEFFRSVAAISWELGLGVVDAPSERG
jgi:hypothetical protein